VSIPEGAFCKLQGQTLLHHVEGCRDFLVQSNKRTKKILKLDIQRLAGDDPPLEFLVMNL